MTSTNASLCEAEALVRLYGKRTAVDGVSFRLPAGANAALLGPNGSGKSTLLRCLATLLAPSSGKLSVLGNPLPKQAASVRRDLAVVFQEPSLDGKLTVAENLRCSGALFGLSGKTLAVRVDEVLADLRLTDRREERVERLSGGLRRRTDLARAFLARPKLLLLDEPTSGLDPNARRDFWESLSHASKQRGVAWIAATHWLEEALRADRLLFFQRGKLVLDGTTKELLSSSSRQVVAVTAKDPSAAARALATALSVEARVEDGAVVFERADAAAVVPEIARVLGTNLEAVTVRQPSLEDLYFRVTGESFVAEEERATA